MRYLIIIHISSSCNKNYNTIRLPTNVFENLIGSFKHLYIPIETEILIFAGL